MLSSVIVVNSWTKISFFPFLLTLMSKSNSKDAKHAITVAILDHHFYNFLHFTDSTDLKDLDLYHKDHTDLKLWNMPIVFSES